MSESHLRKVLVEDIPSLVACHTIVANQSADLLAPVHSHSGRANTNTIINTPYTIMEKKRVAVEVVEKRTGVVMGVVGDGGNVSSSSCSSSSGSSGGGGGSALATDLTHKLTLKNTTTTTTITPGGSSGIVNGIKIGTTDAEVHVPAVLKCNNTTTKQQQHQHQQQHQEEQCSESSHDSTSKSDINGTAVCNGHSVSEATSTSSIAISDTFSINSEKSSDSSHSFSTGTSGGGARPRTNRNTSSNSSHGHNTSTPNTANNKSDNDLSSTSDSLITPEICISPVPSSVDSSGGSGIDLRVEYVNYENELQMSAIMRLIQKDLSEPYSIYTYRYFIHNWPKLCFLAVSSGEVVGAIVCKLDVHKKVTVRGYIAMLAVDHRFRKRRIGSNLVQRAIRAMASDDADEVVLETEITNKPALRLYENLGFVRDKRLFRYYLNGVDALRLKLWLR
ncbi:hypothetical protein Pcinc_015724 [Petrolisthes cinctipes]|uniref:N-terminal methionine N(alpha)-acetyltransferase NatC n=1 Tax=Petrolisthes cinctipes TaxID=88211 RepID=A0AAE1FXQ8_PETCI|nr:hypothetical protein Pcinc_015724 [Petrolisthes cinctipes]